MTSQEQGHPLVCWSGTLDLSAHLSRAAGAVWYVRRAVGRVGIEAAHGAHNHRPSSHSLSANSATDKSVSMINRRCKHTGSHLKACRIAACRITGTFPGIPGHASHCLCHGCKQKPVDLVPPVLRTIRARQSIADGWNQPMVFHFECCRCAKATLTITRWFNLALALLSNKFSCIKT